MSRTNYAKLADFVNGKVVSKSSINMIFPTGSFVHIDNCTGLSIFTQFGRKSDAFDMPAAEYSFFACMRSER
jgi:hypothetical protein